jgi:predicted dehydrogenase
MVEKPLGVTIRAGWKMIETAERYGRVLATAEQVRRWLGPRVLAWAIREAGLIGPPRMFFAQHSSGAKRDPAQPVLDHPRTWRQDKLTGGGGTIFDGGVHYADVLLYLYGDVETVYAVTGNYAGWQYPEPDGTARPAEVEDTAIGHLTFQNGVVGTWTWAGACPGRALSHQIYYGRDGSLYAESTYPLSPELQRWDGQVTPFADLVPQFLASVDEATLHRFFPPEVVPDPAAPTGDYGVELECYDFLEAVRLRRPPDIDGRAGLRAQAVSQAFFESSVSVQAVKVGDVLNGKVDAYQREINERWGL